ncbi:hypothetical protein GEMRC1_006997 [Eukaryota sp. GEM-RC1]
MPCVVLLSPDGTVSPLRVNSPPMNYTHILKNKSYAVCGSSLRSVLDLSCTVFSSRPTFKEDLTMDGDVESNPGPVSQEALDCLQPDHLVDDEVFVEFSRSIFQTYFELQASSVDFDDLFIQPALLKGYYLFLIYR